MDVRMSVSIKLLEFIVTVLLIPAQAGIAVELTLYAQEGSAWQTQKGGECVTTADGRCEIRGRTAEIWPDGLIRGTLEIEGYGERPVIWRGGNISLEIDMNEALHVDGPYDYLDDDNAAPILENEPRGGLSSLIVAIVFLVLTLTIYRKTRKA